MSERTLEKFWALSSNSLFASESMAGVVFKDDSFVYLVLLVLALVRLQERRICVRIYILASRVVLKFLPIIP